MGRKKKLKIRNEDKDEDRLSKLPDEVIHQILSFLDTRLAVQTSILSKRWKLIWTTNPFVTLCYPYCSSTAESKCIQHILSHRNDQVQILKLEFFPSVCLPRGLVKKLVDYSISHEVHNLRLSLVNPDRDNFTLSTFSSNSIKELYLETYLKFDIGWELDIWDLPALTTLHLQNPFERHIKLPQSCLISLPSLLTLRLYGFEVPESFCLLSLTTLRLERCILPNGPCNLPNLLNLELDDVTNPTSMSNFFSALVSLENLILFFRKKGIKDCLINFPQLVNLEITSTNHQPCGNIIVMTPKICNFTSVGIFPVTFGGCELENVYVKLRDPAKCKTRVPSKKLEQYYGRLIFMLQGLGNAKILTLDLETIKALSTISNNLAPLPSPFYNLKYLKLPQGCQESSIVDSVRSYLLSGSPRATIVTTWPQKDMIIQKGPACLAAQNVALDEALTTPTHKVIASQDIDRRVCVDDSTVQEEHLLESSGIEAGSVRQAGGIVQEFAGLKPDALVARADNDKARSSVGNSDFGLWQGHEVNSEFIGLLDLIMKKYPETFENFTTKSKKVCTMKLNFLCTSLDAFTKTSRTEVDTEMVTEYRKLFSDLQSWGFNLKWLVNRLDYVENLLFSPSVLNELRAFDSCVEKTTEICPAFRTMGTSVGLDYLGDGLLSGP